MKYIIAMTMEIFGKHFILDKRHHVLQEQPENQDVNDFWFSIPYRLYNVF